MGITNPLIALSKCAALLLFPAPYLAYPLRKNRAPPLVNSGSPGSWT
jgi:hypothetical protein